jgi:hypothetical protein
VGSLRVASFTVRATAEQSARWKRAAEAEGHRSAGTWLAEAADAYLKARARAGRPLPLAWRRGLFRVLLLDGREVEVCGMVSPPFGEFRGTVEGRDTSKRRTLVHIPTRRVIATLKSARQCKALAAELAPVYARDEATALGIAERHLREAL